MLIVSLRAGAVEQPYSGHEPRSIVFAMTLTVVSWLQRCIVPCCLLMPYGVCPVPKQESDWLLT
jgi:hypothetical protein